MKQKGGNASNIIENLIQFITYMFYNPFGIVIVKFIIILVYLFLLFYWYVPTIQVELMITMIIFHFFASIYIIYNIYNSTDIFNTTIKNTSNILFGSITFGFLSQLITLIIMVSAMYILINENNGSKKFTINEQMYIDNYKSNYIVNTIAISLGCSFLYYLNKTVTDSKTKIVKIILNMIVIIAILTFSSLSYVNSVNFHNKCSNNLFNIKDPPTMQLPTTPAPTENNNVTVTPKVITTAPPTSSPNTAAPGEICI